MSRPVLEHVIPELVTHAFGIEGANVIPITLGLVNQTFEVRTTERRLIVQRLHPVFGPEVNLDLEAVTAHLARKGIPTPLLVRTVSGEPWVAHEGATWRAITFVEGVVQSEVTSPAIAREAGALAGRFHRAIADLGWEIRSTRSGVHDTPAHLAALEGALEASTQSVFAERDEALGVSEAILAAARALEPLPREPLRLVHGDLKITNLLFAAGDPPRGHAVLDLDTLARSTFPIEMGDALRSWCNARGESAEDARVDTALYRAALEGWGTEMRGIVLESERDALALGTETITLELASRFARDVFEDRYFGWDRERYPSRRAHCLVRAKAMLALARSLHAERSELEGIAKSTLSF